MRHKGLELSKVSARTLFSFSHPSLMAINELYPTKSFSSLLRIGGYKVLARLNHSQSRKVRRLRAMSYNQSSGYPFEFWLGRGYPLYPYLKGHLI